MYETLRKLMLPLDELEKLVPGSGRVLDVGCGHGTVARFLAGKSSARIIKGIDPSAQKIKTAKKLGKGVKNLSFERKYAKDEKGKFDCVIITDVLYLLPDREKIKFLRECKRLLKKNGTMIVTTDSHEPKWLFNIIRLQEFIMVNLIRFTHSDYKGFYSLDRKGYAEIIKMAGFTILNTRTFKSIIPYRHIIYVAKINK